MKNTFEEMQIAQKMEDFSSMKQDPRFLPMDDIDSAKSIDVIKAERLSNKLKGEMRKLTNPTRQEVKTLVDLFYQMQDQRKRLREQIRAIESGTDEGTSSNILMLDLALKNTQIMELNTQDSLQIICENSEVGRWLLQITGIGPVLAAGCLAYFDVTGIEHASHFISYAGLNDNQRPWLGRVGAECCMEQAMQGRKGNPTDEEVALFSGLTKWGIAYLQKFAYDQEKGVWSRAKLISAAAKVPYNRELKTHMWKIGASFQWCCNKPQSLYGRLFSERRIHETLLNEQGAYAPQAQQILATKNIGKGTEAYKAYSQGKLPKAHINARCMRWAEKIFLSHLFEQMYRVANGRAPAPYYVFEHLKGHNDIIQPEVPFSPAAPYVPPMITDPQPNLQPRVQIPNNNNDSFNQLVDENGFSTLNPADYGF